METLYAAVDLGGTKIAAALGTAAGELLHTETVPTPPGVTPETILSLSASLVDSLATGAGQRPAALGVGVPTFSPQWHGVPAGAFLEHSLRMPVRVMNDARCATLGELLHGHGREYPTFALFTLGAGIGGGIVIDGRLRLGPLSAAGELGHQTILPDGPVCGCGNAGCLEALASGPAIARAAGYPDTESAANAARDGNAQAQRAFRDAAKYLGIAAANLVAVLHPDAILFSGGMSGLVDLLLMPVRAAINERVRLFPPEGVAVRRAGAGPNACLLGALALNTAPDKIGT